MKVAPIDTRDDTHRASPATVPASRYAEMPIPIPPSTIGNSERPRIASGGRFVIENDKRLETSIYSYTNTVIPDGGLRPRSNAEAGSTPSVEAGDTTGPDD